MGEPAREQEYKEGHVQTVVLPVTVYGAGGAHGGLVHLLLTGGQEEEESWSRKDVGEHVMGALQKPADVLNIIGLVELGKI